MKLTYIAMGGSTHTRRWVEYFRDAGSRISLISFYPCDPIPGVEVEVLECKNRASMLMKLPRVKKLIAEFQPDILHAHYASSCGIMAALTGFKPFVLSTWGDDIMVFPNRSPLHRRAVAWAIRKADHVTATSKILRDRTAALLGESREVSVIPFGVDLDKFSCVERENSETVHIGAVRWLTPKYGLDYLIRAVAVLVRKGLSVRLTMIGLGFMRTELEALVGKLGLKNQVTFTGHLANRDVIEYYRKFDLVAMPSVSEGETFGVAAVEAMAAGLPVVASNVGGLPEVVVDGVTGRLVNPADVESLAEGLEFYVTNQQARRQHGQNGRKRVEQLFDWQENAATMMQLYKSILGKD